MNQENVDLITLVIQAISEYPLISIGTVGALYMILRPSSRQGPSSAAVDSQIKAKKDEFNNAVKQATEGIENAKINYDNAKRDYESERDSADDKV